MADRIDELALSCRCGRKQMKVASGVKPDIDACRCFLATSHREKKYRESSQAYKARRSATANGITGERKDLQTSH